MTSMGSSPCLNTGIVRPKSSELEYCETDKVIHTVEIDIVKLVVEIESFGMSADEFDKETGSSDGLQPKQVDLSHPRRGLDGIRVRGRDIIIFRTQSTRERPLMDVLKIITRCIV
ncbi:hypothetical protein Tco_1212656 [Tanacetum coccineum]